MNLLIKNRMSLYWVGFIFYVICFNIIFYTSKSLLLITLASIGNLFILLAVIGMFLHTRKRKSEKIARENKRRERKEKLAA